MLEKVIEILAQFTEVSADEINEKSNLVQDLDLDSLDVINIVVEFEEEFGVEIADRDIKKLVLVEDILAYLNENED